MEASMIDPKKTAPFSLIRDCEESGRIGEPHLVETTYKGGKPISISLPPFAEAALKELLANAAENDPRVRALVEAATHALPAVRGLIEAAQKYGVFDNLLPELFPDSARRGVKRADGFANVMSAQADAKAWLDCLEAALAALAAQGGET
jgi:hypothetical protein